MTSGFYTRSSHGITHLEEVHLNPFSLCKRSTCYHPEGVCISTTSQPHDGFGCTYQIFVFRFLETFLLSSLDIYFIFINKQFVFGKYSLHKHITKEIQINLKIAVSRNKTNNSKLILKKVLLCNIFYPKVFLQLAKLIFSDATEILKDRIYEV